MSAGAEIGAGVCCNFIVEAIQMTFCNMRTYGANGLSCLNCRCGCCWDAGELNPDDLPDEAKAARAAKLKKEQEEKEAAETTNTVSKAYPPPPAGSMQVPSPTATDDSAAKK